MLKPTMEDDATGDGECCKGCTVPHASDGKPRDAMVVLRSLMEVSGAGDDGYGTLRRRDQWCDDDVLVRDGVARGHEPATRGCFKVTGTELQGSASMTRSP